MVNPRTGQLQSGRSAEELQQELQLRASLEAVAQERDRLDLRPPSPRRFSFQPGPDPLDRWDGSRRVSSPRQRSRSPRRRRSPVRRLRLSLSRSPRRGSPPLRPYPLRSSPPRRIGPQFDPYTHRRAQESFAPPFPAFRRRSPPISARDLGREPALPEGELWYGRSEDYRGFARSEDEPRLYRRESPPRAAASDPAQLDFVRAATAEAAATAVQSAIQPFQQSLQVLQQQQQERSLPPVRKPAFSAVLSALQLLPASAQPHLQPFCLALRAADTLDTEEQSVQALQSLTRYCIDNPQASASDLQQQAKLSVVNSAPFLASLLSSSAQPFLSLLAASQTATPQQPPSAGHSSSVTCYRCGKQGHYSSACRETTNVGGDPLNPLAGNKYGPGPKPWAKPK